MTRYLALVVGLIALHAAPAVPAELDVRVADARGAPVADAVVTAVPRANSVSIAPPGQSRTHVIDQQNETFIPYIEVFRPGDKVVFHNSDHTRHHAYSFAPARQFEFVLAPGETSTPLQLDHPGVIAVGCNIHDQMITYFYVTDAPLVARSGSDGHARIELPAGSFDVRVWHPRQRPGSPDNAQEFTAANDSAPADLTYTLSLLPDQRSAPDRERSSY
jgi:plastocyanin